MAKKRDRRGAGAVKELYVFCEGQTEQNFCKQVLAPHCISGYTNVPTSASPSADIRGSYIGGGVLKYEPARKDILNTMKSGARMGVFHHHVDL